MDSIRKARVRGASTFREFTPVVANGYKARQRSDAPLVCGSHGCSGGANGIVRPGNTNLHGHGPKGQNQFMIKLRPNRSRTQPRCNAARTGAMRAPDSRFQSPTPGMSLRALSLPDRQSAPGPEPAPAPPAPGSLDITAAVSGWDYEPGRLNVRKVLGDDGRPKLQVRLDLGLLQMELSGRPDGRQPRDYSSLLEYHVDRLNVHRTRYGTELGFVLSPNDCRELRDEAGLYYHRYLGLFILGDYSGTLADTARNLAALDFCARHAAEERDRLLMEAFRPYLLMMHARAAAAMAFQADEPRKALHAIRTGLRQIRQHFSRFGGRRAYRVSAEVRVLRDLSSLMSRYVPQNPVRRLKRQLRLAVRRENYERAAMLRDELARRGA